MLRRYLTLALVAAALVVVALPAEAAPVVPTGPTGDALYLPPDPLPKAKPGTLIRAQPISAPTGANGWRVLYHSRSVAGRDIAVSGVVWLLGSAPKGGRLIVSWAHGGAGIADRCAPSRQFTSPTALVPLVVGLLAQGDVVVATDYEGLGTPGVAPFLVGISEGRSVLDAAAARQVRGAGAGKRLIVAGHSEGGHGALFAGELAASYARELTLLGVEAGAPAADLTVIVPAALRSPPVAGYGVLAVVGFHAAYPRAEIGAVLTPDAVTRAAIADTGCTREVITSYAQGPQPITAHDPTTVEPWAGLLRKNSAGNRRIGVPVLVIQGDADRTIPKGLTDRFASKACAVGDTVDYRTYPGTSHDGSLSAAQPDILAWIAARAAGNHRGQPARHRDARGLRLLSLLMLERRRRDLGTTALARSEDDDRLEVVPSIWKA